MATKERRPRKKVVKLGGIFHTCEKCQHQSELFVTTKNDKPEENSKKRKLDDVKTKEESKEEKSIVTSTGVTSLKSSASAASPFPLLVQFNHQGLWLTDEKTNIHTGTMDETKGRGSVMLTPNCLLSVHKLAMRHKCLSLGIVKPHHIDNANLICHSIIRKSPGDAFSHFKTVQGEKFLIERTDMSAKNDFLTIELDRDRDIHCTMIYRKGIGKEVDLIKLFEEVLETLHKNPHLIKEYASLPDFGKDVIDYWSETPQLYPDNVSLPEDYKPSTQKPMSRCEKRLRELTGKSLDQVEISPTGSIAF
jgi:hypothetical protein